MLSGEFVPWTPRGKFIVFPSNLQCNQGNVALGDRVSIYFPWSSESVCEWWLSPPLCILANKQHHYRCTG